MSWSNGPGQSTLLLGLSWGFGSLRIPEWHKLHHPPTDNLEFDLWSIANISNYGNRMWKSALACAGPAWEEIFEDWDHTGRSTLVWRQMHIFPWWRLYTMNYKNDPFPPTRNEICLKNARTPSWNPSVWSWLKYQRLGFFFSPFPKIALKK